VSWPSPNQLRGWEDPPQDPPKKHKRRRCLASLDMTINGGGKSPLLQLLPKKTLCLWGKVRKGWNPRSNIRRSLTKGVRDDTSCRFEGGTFIPFNWTEEIPRAEALGMTPLGHPEERKRRGVSINGGGLCPPPTPPKKNFCLSGKRRRSFASLRTTKIRSVGKGCPLPIMCHPEPPLRGVSSLNRGGWKSPPQDSPKGLRLFWGKAEILRFAQDDTSCRFEGGLLPLSIE